MTGGSDTGERFWNLHLQPDPFLIPNPWDIGTARMLADKGFAALATTSSGLVFSMGRQEGSLRRDEMLDHCQEIAGAVGIAVNADLEDGYADDLDGVRETYRLAAATGLAGGSIEDARFAAAAPLYDFGQSVARVEAAVDAVKALPAKFVLTARAENFLYGNPDLPDTIRRLQAYQEAGADVLFAPGLTSLDDIAEVVRSVDCPVNVNVGLKDTQFSVAELASAGVKRISIGSALFRHAFGAAVAAADEMLATGRFDFAEQAMPFAAINALFAPDRA